MLGIGDAVFVNDISHAEVAAAAAALEEIAAAGAHSFVENNNIVAVPARAAAWAV